MKLFKNTPKSVVVVNEIFYYDTKMSLLVLFVDIT